MTENEATFDRRDIIWQRAPFANDELAALRELNRELVDMLDVTADRLERAGFMVANARAIIAKARGGEVKKIKSARIRTSGPKIGLSHMEITTEIGIPDAGLKVLSDEWGRMRRQVAIAPHGTYIMLEIERGGE